MLREATWTNIGTDVREASNVHEALAISGLNYKVVKQPIYLPNGSEVNGHYATVKEGTSETFGIVGSDYEIVQNEAAFEFIDEIVDNGLQFVKAGETKNLVYIIAKLPERYVLNDKYNPYIIFQNSHNGYSTLRAAICPLRIVCQNQFTMAFKNADNKISLRHSSSIHDRLTEAQRILQLSAEYMDTFEETANKLAVTNISPVVKERILDEYFKVPEDASTRKLINIEEKRQQFMTALQADDNSNFKNTAWGMINAFSDYITHTSPKRRTETSDLNRFTTVTFDPKLMFGFTTVVMRNIA